MRWLSEKEEATLLAFAPDYFRPAIVISINSGLRDAELRKLTWADVDFERGVLTIRHTKSKRDRVVPMNETLRRTLQQIPRHMTCPHVFTNAKTGRMLTHGFNNTTWKKTLKRAGITKLRWHDLRHTFASRLAQKGVPLQVIKELLGHSTLQMVLRYAHLQQQNLRDAVAALDPAKVVERAAQ